MNVIKLKVDFTKRYLNIDCISIVEGDYNSTKAVFEFDEAHKNIGRKIFEIAKKDSTEAIFVAEIINNEVVLTGKSEVKDTNGYIKYVDDNDNIYWYDKVNNKIYDNEYVEQPEIQINTLTQVLIDGPIFDTEGKHYCEVSLYDGDSKLTSAYGSIYIAKEMVKIGDREVITYLPVFDQLINDLNVATEAANVATEAANNLDIDEVKVGTTATITITKKDGTVKEVEIHDGERGPQGEQGIQGPTGQTGAQGPKGEQGIQGIKGDTGERGLQGEQGIKGDKGETGPSNVLTIGTVTKGEEAGASITGTSPNQQLNLVLPKGDKGDKGDTGSQGIQGPQGERGLQGETGPQGETGATGPQGPKGDTGDTGPKGDTGVGVPSGGTTGQVLKKVDGTDYNTEWGNAGGFVDDVQINGTSIVDENKVANIPVGTNNAFGVFKTSGSYGVKNVNGILEVQSASNVGIDSRSSNYFPIVPANLDYAVRSVRPEVITTAPELVKVNDIYPLGERTSLTIQLPSGQVGDFFEIQFISKTTPTTLTITSSYGMTDLDLTPEANTIYNIYGEWTLVDVDTYGWFLKYADAPIPSVGV